LQAGAYEGGRKGRYCKKGVFIWENYRDIGTELKLENTQPK
jgi:hypothetical protein